MLRKAALRPAQGNVPAEIWRLIVAQCDCYGPGTSTTQRKHQEPDAMSHRSRAAMPVDEPFCSPIIWLAVGVLLTFILVVGLFFIH